LRSSKIDDIIISVRIIENAGSQKIFVMLFESNNFIPLHAKFSILNQKKFKYNLFLPNHFRSLALMIFNHPSKFGMITKEFSMSDLKAFDI
jgi:hypothetical protein